MQRKDLLVHNFMKYAFNTGLRLVAYELIYFRLGMMLDTTKLHNMILVWMALNFSRDHRVAWWLSMEGRWFQRKPVSMVNIDH